MNKPYAITLDIGSSLVNKTGSWRTERPVYVDRLPPCNNACPAGENIQQWLYLAEEGNYEGAWRELMKNNPMPAVMGRVCYHPCEDCCNRAKLDSAVGIHSVERFLGDLAIRNQWKVENTAPRSGKRVLVVGAGPSGLSAAYHLTLLGHEVTIFEAGPMAGGMMRFGIPKYRLPREVLDAEIRRLTDMGVKIRLNHKVSNLDETMKTERFDAVFLAVGAHLAKRAYIPAGDAGKILDALQLLRGVETGQQPLLGRRVLVYGGGNTAMDVARSAKRLGATEALHKGLGTILTSDYYYPSLLHAAFRLVRDGVLPFGAAWALVSSAPAHAARLEDRGRIEAGLRADLIVVDDSQESLPRVSMAVVEGRLAHLGDPGVWNG